MKVLFTFAGLALALWSSASFATVLSPSGLESVMSFQAQVFLPQEAAANAAGGNRQALYSHLILEQTKHLLGIFETPQFTTRNNLLPNNRLGSVGLGSLIDFKVIQETRVEGGWEITYRAREKVIILKKLLGPGQTKIVDITFPHDPLRFYSPNCTDSTYPQKQYLFYYWNPFAIRCRPDLIGKNKVDTVKAQIRGSTPPANTPPSFAQLSRQIQRHGELRIALLLGFNEKSTDPQDLGRLSFNYFQKVFAEKMHFEVDRHRNTPTGPFVDFYRPASDGHYAVRLNLSLSASDVDRPVVFARRAREALENADIVMYVGHSGLGGNLNLEMITRLSSPDPQHPVPIHFPNEYQIYYLDSCASFFFYSDEYALVRRGIHNVDIVTNGTSSYFTTQNRETLNFLVNFINPSGSPSWTEILQSVEIPARTFSYMVNVQKVR